MFQIPKRNFRAVGCQTSDLIRIFDLLDPSPPVSDEFIWEAVRDNVDFSNKKKMKGKAVQAGLVLILEISYYMFENR